SYNWGAEFSPDSKKLYFTQQYFCYRIYQADIGLFDKAAIESSVKIVREEALIDPYNDLKYAPYGVMKLGPDGKIYIPGNYRAICYYIKNHNDEAENIKINTFRFKTPQPILGHFWGLPTTAMPVRSVAACNSVCTVDGSIETLDTLLATGSILCM